MKSKTIITIIVAILVLGSLVWIARPAGFSDNTASSLGSNTHLSDEDRELTVEEAGNYDFGTISMAAGEVKHQFKIKNMSGEPVMIDKIYTSCMCTTAELTVRGEQFGPYGMPGHGVIPKINQIINPSEEAIVEVVFDPAAHGPAGVGRIQRTVTIENDGGQPIELQFAAIVTP